MTPNLISNDSAIGLDAYTGTTLWVFQVKICRFLSQSYGTAQRTDFSHPIWTCYQGYQKQCWLHAVIQCR